MKKLFSIMFSLQLIISPVSFAEEDQYKITGSGSQAGMGQYLQSVMMTGSGIVGSNFMFCKGFIGNTIPTFSHYIFMGGAMTLLTGEIVAATKQAKQKKEDEKQIERMTILANQPIEGMTKEQRDIQLVALESAKKEEEKNRDALQARMRWLKATETIYWLSVAGATTEFGLYWLTKTPGYGESIGYRDWGLSCGGLLKYQKITKQAVALAYGMSPELISLDFKSALMKGISAKSFMGALSWTTDHVGEKVLNGINSAPGRIILFGLFAGMAKTVGDGFRDRRDLANKNIALFDKALADWKKTAAVTDEIKPGTADEGSNSDEKINQKKHDLKPLTVDKLGKCFSATSDGLEHSAKACSNPVKFKKASINLKSKYLQGLSVKSFDLAEALARDDLASADILAGELGSNAAKAKAEALEMLKTVVAEQKKRGEKPLDFEKDVNAQLASFSKQAQASGLLGDSSALGKLSLSEDEMKKESEIKVTNSPAPTVATPAPAMPDFSTSGTEEMAVDDIGSTKAAPEQSLADFESTEQDISKEPEVSIFKQVSNRYILNYTKMFERKKVPSVPNEAAKE